MKKPNTILITLLCITSWLPNVAQETFNVRVNFGFPHTSLFGVLETSDGYLIEGSLGDSINPAATPSIFAKLDFVGNEVFHKAYGGVDDLQLFAQFDTFQYSNDTLVSHTGYTWDEEGVFHTYIMTYNLQGDTTSMLKIYSPYIDNPDSPSPSLIWPYAMAMAPNGDFILASTVASPTTWEDTSIQRISPDGTIVWQAFYSTFHETDRSYKIKIVDELIYLSMYELNPGASMRMLIMDFEGSVVGESDVQAFGKIYDFIAQPEYETYIGVGIQPVNTSGQLAKVFKFGFDGETIWELVLGEDLWFFQHFNNIVQTDDGNFVALGTFYDHLDESTEIDGTYNWEAWLVKFDQDGNLLWERRIHHVESPQDKHVAFDLQKTSDGGFIFCGEATDSYQAEGWENDIPQQGWVVKVNEHGCLVEGCEEFDNSILEGEELPVHFKIGPIPTKQSLNIHQFTGTSAGSKFQIYDLQGKLVHEFLAANQSMTLVVNTGNYAKGVYVLSLRDEGRNIQTEKFVIE